MIMSDLHTHTTFCDGRDTAAEMVRAAYERGFESIGLSSHSYTPFGGGYGMTPEVAAAYRAEVRRLKAEYRGKIDVYLGIEQDVYSECAEGYDYIIGAAHYIVRGAENVTVDYTAEIAGRGVSEMFGGDWMKYIAAYYETAARIPEVTGADFIAHFDLVTKINEANRFFDEESREYRAIAYEALCHASKKCRIFEMNSGAVKRKKRTRPYPDTFLLKSMKELGCEIVLSSDAHNTESVGFYFDEMAQIARECGFKYAKRFNGAGFADYAL